jgi:hypothetical protein
LAGCSSSSSEDSEEPTESNETGTPTDENETSTESQNSLFSDYYTDGDEFVVKLNSGTNGSVEEIILHYNEGDPANHPTKSVQGISTVRFPLQVDGKNDPTEGTWEIEAVGPEGTIETVEFEAERNLSLDKIGTVAQSNKFENVDGLQVGDIQFSIINDGDIPTTPYLFELTSSFNSGGELSGTRAVVGLGEGNPEPVIASDETLTFRISGRLCFDLQKDESAEQWVDQTGELGLTANAGTASESWTYPLSVDFGSEIESQDLSECIKGTTVSKR